MYHDNENEKPSLQSNFTLSQSKFFSRLNSFFQNTKENFGGKKFTLQMNEVLLQKTKIQTKCVIKKLDI
jgi:hypothetical protein